MKAAKSKFKSMVWALTKAQKITASAHKVLMVLAGHFTRDGAFPAHATLAAEAGCSRSTVIRALASAYALGIITRTRRMARMGTLKVRTSNAYQFIMDKAGQAVAAAKELMGAIRKRASQERAAYTQKMKAKHLQNLSVILKPNTQLDIISSMQEAVDNHTTHWTHEQYLAAIASWER